MSLLHVRDYRVATCVAAILPAALTAAEPQPPYFGREHAVSADKSLIVEPPPELRKLKTSRNAVFEVPPEIRVWDFRSKKIEAGPLLLSAPRKREENGPNHTSEPASPSRGGSS